jgi:putative membrane protein
VETIERPSAKRLERYPPRAISIADRIAKRWIWVFSAIVFLAVTILNSVQVPAPDGFDVHVFARINAVINSAVSVLLLVGLFSAKNGRWSLHRRVMLTALVLSVLFLVSYILHHLFAGDTPFGGTGAVKVVYYVILATHIVLAGLSLPFILLAAYRSLSAEYPAHRKLAKKVWPVWFYVSVTGVVVYFFISPYY